MEVDSVTPEVAASETTEVKMASPEKASSEKASPEKPVEKTPIKKIEAPEVKTPSKEDSPPKNNGTLAGVAAAAAANAVASAATKKEEKTFLPGIVVQFPEMFSMKRDNHILQKFDTAADIRMQKYAYVECESEEVAIKLQNKLHNSTLNNKKVQASRLDTAEGNVLYLGAVKKETTDDMLKTLLPGIEQIKRENSSSRYNTFVLFSGETECRAAKTKITKEGLNGQSINCEFDTKKDRFKPAEEPAAKKAKEDADADATKEKEEETKKEEKEESEEKTVVGKSTETVTVEDDDEENEVKADEY